MESNKVWIRKSFGSMEIMQDMNIPDLVLSSLLMNSNYKCNTYKCKTVLTLSDPCAVLYITNDPELAHCSKRPKILSAL